MKKLDGLYDLFFSDRTERIVNRLFIVMVIAFLLFVSVKIANAKDDPCTVMGNLANAAVIDRDAGIPEDQEEASMDTILQNAGIATEDVEAVLHSVIRYAYVSGKSGELVRDNVVLMCQKAGEGK